MPASVRNRTAATRQERINTTTFRVTKSNKFNNQKLASKQKLQAIEQSLEQKQPFRNQQPEQGVHNAKKRRHEAITDSDVENEEVTILPTKPLKKPRRNTIPTPPASSPEPEILPACLQELRTLHSAFTQALTVHFSHNSKSGSGCTVALPEILPATTRLWKLRDVSQRDIEQMLAVWEIAEELPIGHEIGHKRGPFRMVTSGIGSNIVTRLEYTWVERDATSVSRFVFLENELQRKFETAIEKLHQNAQRVRQTHAYIFDSANPFPRLKCEVGLQTQARQAKLSSIREQILGVKTSKQGALSASPSSSDRAEPDFSKLQISDPMDMGISKATTLREDRLKSRTLGLFDRLKAKQLANSTNSSSLQSPADQLRCRALHRLPGLISLLRLKQSQKLNTLFRSDLHGRPGGTRTTKMKVSFSLEGLVQEVRDTSASGMGTPMSAEEVREGILILGREVPDIWCSVYCAEGNGNGAGLKCVTFQGEGWRKEEIKDWCEREIKKMNGK